MYCRVLLFHNTHYTPFHHILILMPLLHLLADISAHIDHYDSYRDEYHQFLLLTTSSTASSAYPKRRETFATRPDARWTFSKSTSWAKDTFVNVIIQRLYIASVVIIRVSIFNLSLPRLVPSLCITTFAI